MSNFKSSTRIIELIVVLLIPTFARRSRPREANVGIGPLARKRRHHLDLRREQELVDRHDARRDGSRRRSGCARRGASVAGLHDTAATFGTRDRAIASACALAPAAGGSKTTAPKAIEFSGASGLRKRSRRRVVTGFRPRAGARPRSSARAASRSPSTAVTGARRASRRQNVPQPANRSATGAASPTWASDGLCQCRLRRCRGLNEPTGAGSSTAAIASISGRRFTKISLPSTVRRASAGIAGERAECRQQPLVRPAAAADGDIETVVGGDHGMRAGCRGLTARPAIWRRSVASRATIAGDQHRALLDRQ